MARERLFARRLLAEPARTSETDRHAEIAGPGRSALLACVSMLALSVVLVQVELRGWLVLGSEDATRHVIVAVKALTLGGALLGVEVSRQRWLLSGSPTAAFSVSLLAVLAALVVLPPIVVVGAPTIWVETVELIGYLSVTVVSGFFYASQRSNDRPNVRRRVFLGLGLSAGLGAALCSVAWVEMAVVAHLPLLGSVVLSGFFLAFVALRQSYRRDQPMLRWVMLLHLALAVSALGRMSVLETARPIASASLSLGIGVVAVLTASLVELSQTALVERERLVLARNETTRALDRLVEQTRAHHEIAHDTQNAIAAIDGSLRVLGNKPSAEVQSWLVDAVRSEMQRLRRLTSAPHRSESIAPFDPAQVLRPMVTCYRLAEHPVSLVVEEPVWVSGRPGDFAEAVQNLLDNAIRYADASRIDVRIGIHCGRATVSVIDDGVGIPTHERDAIFRSGFRGSTSVGAGTGLGVYLAHSLISGQQGRLELLETAKGATFRVSLPQAEQVIDLRDHPAELDDVVSLELDA